MISSGRPLSQRIHFMKLIITLNEYTQLPTGLIFSFISCFVFEEVLGKTVDF